jgi:glycosyltransferase A (GT-A) superfamily protein (DUF2064 family)
MAKASVPGQTKTRLVPPLTFMEAAMLNTAFLADVADNLALAARETSIAAYMAFGPPGSAPFLEALLPHQVGLIETWYPNFGVCLFEAAKVMLDLGYGSACLLNSDSPTLPTGYLAQIAAILSRPGDRMVLGPSNDGGYYIIGIKTLHNRLFEDVAWSTEAVTHQTLERAKELRLETILLPAWYDVDDAASLRRLVAETLEETTPSDGPARHAASRSKAVLRELIADTDFALRLDLKAGAGRRQIVGA